MLLLTLLSCSRHFLRAVLLNGAQKKLFHLLNKAVNERIFISFGKFNPTDANQTDGEV
jgi:hypothetical protein